MRPRGFPGELRRGRDPLNADRPASEPSAQAAPSDSERAAPPNTAASEAAWPSAVVVLLVTALVVAATAYGAYYRDAQIVVGAVTGLAVVVAFARRRCWVTDLRFGPVIACLAFAMWAALRTLVDGDGARLTGAPVLAVGVAVEALRVDPAHQVGRAGAQRLLQQGVGAGCAPDPVLGKATIRTSRACSRRSAASRTPWRPSNP